MSKLKRRPSPALVISIIALFVALGSGAYAASKISTKDIKGKAVTTPKLANNAVKSSKAKGLKGKDFKNGTIGGKKLAQIVEVEDSTNVAATAIGGESVNCPQGTKVIGGGFDTDSNLVTNFGLAVANHRDNNGWTASIISTGGTTELTVYAYCL